MPGYLHINIGNHMYCDIILKNFTQQPLTYQSNDLIDSNKIGYRVIIPFGKNEKLGIVFKLASETSLNPTSIKPCVSICDDYPLIPKNHIVFLEKIARYYHISINELTLLAIPKHAMDASLKMPHQFFIHNPFSANKYHTQAKKVAPNATHWSTLYQKTNRTLLDTLIQSQAIIEAKHQPSKTHDSKLEPLNPEQQTVVSSILASSPSTHLIWGITGCGKTEMYAHLIQHVLNQKQQVLLMVPEIALTPQTVAKIASRIGFEPTPIHSQLSPKMRLSNWHKARHGLAKVIVGTRSALLTPIQNLGMIIIDEEHDDSYRQDGSISFSARDSGVLLGNLLNIPVILGSATPSLESLLNAQKDKYTLHEVRKRYYSGHPKISLVQLKKNEVISETLISRIQDQLSANQHVMLYIGKRGYSRLMACHQCGFQLRCNGCDRPFVQHLGNQLKCHHCDVSEPWVQDCPKCHQAELSPYGAGSQKIAELAETYWPQHPCIRLDSDNSSKLNVSEQLLALENAPATIIVGTQMITKGHDIGRLNTVVVVNIDQGLFAIDFRAEEKLFAELVQVSGRSGRRQETGHVYLQTRSPDHSIFAGLSDPLTFYQHILSQRQSFKLPPYDHLSCIFLFGSEKQLSGLTSLILPTVNDSTVLGPMPFPAGKRKNILCYKVMISNICRIKRDRSFTTIKTFLCQKKHARVRITYQVDSHLST